MECESCERLRAELAEMTKDRDFYRDGFRKLTEAFAAYSRPWWSGMTAPDAGSAARRRPEER